MDRNSDFFDDIEEKTNVKKDDVFQLANSVQSADLADEKTVRRLITQVSQLAGVPVSKEKEDRLVKTIVNNEIPLDFSTLAKMFNQSK
ncbi:MAG TPA: stage VI sporulation protein F [Bacillales bacterium]|nr:stage VI sporulation protein F [Bacillales bacterium]